MSGESAHHASEPRRPGIQELYDRTSHDTPTPRRYSGPAKTRLARAIRELNAAGHDIGDEYELVTFIAEAVAAVQRGDSGFNLSRVHTGADRYVELLPETTRVFYGGAVADPRDPVRTNTALPARNVAEKMSDLANNYGEPTVTLERLGDAAVIDTLNLWGDDTQQVLTLAFARLAAERPDLTRNWCDKRGDFDAQAFATSVWKEGLSTQYAREADGKVVVINTAPFEKQTWFTHERPALLANEKIDRDDIVYIGFTHHPLSWEAATVKQQRSEALNYPTGPMTDREAEAQIDFTGTPPRLPSGVPEILPLTAEQAQELGEYAQRNSAEARETADYAANSAKNPPSYPSGHYAPGPADYLPDITPNNPSSGPRPS